MTILIKNGRVINPATGTDETLDVLVENGVVARTEKSIKEKMRPRDRCEGLLCHAGVYRHACAFKRSGI